MQDMEQIYKQYFETVNKYLFCLTHNSDISEELTQEIFYRAVKKINTFKGDCKMSVWLCQIAKNLWYDELKKKKKVENIGDEMLSIQSEDKIEEKVILNESKVELYKKIQRLDTTKKDSKEVNYIKKFNNKMKILKMIIIGILLILVLSLARNIIILVSLNNRADNYTSSSNFYMKKVNYGGATEDIDIYEKYVKDNKYIMKAKTVSDFCIIKSANYYNGETLNRYVEFKYAEENEKNQSSKIAYLNDNENILFPTLLNELDFEYSTQIHGIALIFSNITSEICNTKECYRVSIPSLKGGSSTIYYVEKETGLTVRIIGGRSVGVDGTHYDSVTDFKYKFDVVTDEDFIEPDISEYEIQE